MSGDSAMEDKVVLENNLKNQLLKGCCQVFHRQSGREIAVLGCLAVTIKSQSANVSPVVYFVHINQILTDQDYKLSSEKSGNMTRSDGDSNNSVLKNIKTEPEAANASLFNVLPAEMIPPGKGFVVKTQTVYEKTADGEERKVSVSTQGLIDTCDMKAFAGHQQESSSYKQEPEECHFQNNEYYEDGYDQGNYTDNGMTGEEYDQTYPAEGGEYYEEVYEVPRPVKTPKKTNNKNRASNLAKKASANFKHRTSDASFSEGRNGERYYESEHQRQPPKIKRPHVSRSFGSKLGHATRDPSNPYVVTRSMHECGYPGCGKRFKWKQHLLRHQTEKHGRVPSKKMAFEKVLVRNPNYQRQTNNSYCTTVSADEEYMEDYDGNPDSGASFAGGQDYYYD